jgi:hypothetical protein
MAHKKRRDEPSAEIELPKFDEEEFMRNDMEGTKASVWSILYAIPATLVAFAVTVALEAPVVALGVGLLFLVTLRRVLPLLRVKTAAFKLKDWLGHSVTFFFSFLAFWILVMNPPFSDFTAPEIHLVRINGVAVSDGILDISVSNVTNWTNALIAVDVGDNAALREVTFTLNGIDNGTVMVESGGRYTATVNLILPAGNREACITAVDRADLETSFCFTIRPG